MSNLSFGVLFLEGLLSFFTPCVLPLLPAYLGTISGTAVGDLASGAHRARLVLSTLCFIAGFAVVFVALGAAVTAIGGFLTQHIKTLRIIGGVLIVLFGVVMLEVIPLPFLQREKRFTTSATGYGGAFLLGMAFSFGWTPCIGPLLAGTMLMISTSGVSVWRGMALLLSYAVGLGLPFLLVSLFAKLLLPRFKRLGKHTLTIKRIAGGILILMGILVMTDSLAVFARL